MLYLKQYQHRSGESPELCFALGPITLGEVGLGDHESLFSKVWRLAWRQDGKLILSQQQEAGWVDVEEVTGLIGAASRHLSLAFDQLGNWVIAWEEAGQIHLHESSTTTTYGPFAGHDPLLFMDATLSRDIPGSDVCLFYLSADRLSLLSRIQREAYNAVNTDYTYASSAELERVVIHDFELEIKGIPENVVSGFYPIQSMDQVSTDGIFSDGEIEFLIYEIQSQDAFAASGEFVGGINDDVFSKSLTENLTTAGAFNSGVIEVAFIRTNSDNLNFLGAFSGLSRDNIGIPQVGTDTLSQSGSFTGGIRA